MARNDTSTLVRISTYAEMCGVTHSAVLRRIRQKQIQAHEIDGTLFVDTRVFPPIKRLKKQAKNE